jgi:hypothetical protein
LGCLALGTRVKIIKNFSWGPWLLIRAQHSSPLEGLAHFMGDLPVPFCVISRNRNEEKMKKFFWEKNYSFLKIIQNFNDFL